MKVVQCWDDGVVDDIRLVEVFRRHGAKASFNLNFGAHRKERYHEWTYQDRKPVFKLALGELREVYDGFVVANHTMTHPDLTKIPLDQAAREIREGKDRLEQHFGRPVTGFAYPFGTHNADVARLVREAGHLYGRTTVRVGTVWPPADAARFHPSSHFRDAQFWERYEQVREADGVFYVWGHSFELVTEDDWRACEAQIARISNDPSAEWTWLPDLFAEKKAGA